MIGYRVVPRLCVVNKALYEQEGLGCGWYRRPCHTHTPLKGATLSWVTILGCPLVSLQEELWRQL